MKFSKYIPDHAATTVPVLALLVLLHFMLTRDDVADSGIELVPPVQLDKDLLALERRGEFNIDDEIERLKIHDRQRDQRIRELLHKGKYKLARTRLLEIAAGAVARDDNDQLGDTLLLLGEVSMQQQELGAAEIYLQEALYLTMSQGNLLGAARCYQQLGQLNIKARALARQASNTYDELWQARNAMSRGLLHGVDQNLQSVIRENMEIRRYGAAAEAWEALASLHDQLHDDYPAQQASMEAARLYASTGQIGKSRKLIADLDRRQIGEGELLQIEREIDDLFEAHQQDLVQTSVAHDYEMLFHHYQRNGDIDRAWSFRIKASESLANTTDHALFQRQADVIAVLYNSNFAMERARRYLGQAGLIYRDSQGGALLDQTLEMEALIY